MSISILMDGWLVSPPEHGGSSLWREKHLEVRGVIRAAWRRSRYQSRTGRYYQTARRSYPHLSSARPPKPDVIVHEMTSLSGVNNLRRFDPPRKRNRFRPEGGPARARYWPDRGLPIRQGRFHGETVSSTRMSANVASSALCGHLKWTVWCGPFAQARRASPP